MPGIEEKDAVGMVKSSIALVQAVREFYEEYTTCLDDSDFERWPSFFADDADYRIISRENFDRGLPMASMTCNGIGMIRDRVTALMKVLVYEPRYLRRYVSSVRVVSEEGNIIKSRANFLLFESMMDREPKLNMLGRYHDTLLRDGDGFRIKERNCVYDNYRILTTLYAPV
jgi:anthranilate 1,2-dioxygenase small subunit